MREIFTGLLAVSLEDVRVETVKWRVRVRRDRCETAAGEKSERGEGEETSLLGYWLCCLCCKDEALPAASCFRRQSPLDR